LQYSSSKKENFNFWHVHTLRSVFVNSPPPKPEIILTNFFAEPTVLLVPITSRGINSFYLVFYRICYFAYHVIISSILWLYEDSVCIYKFIQGRVVMNAEWIFGHINLFISERDYKDIVDFFHSDSIQWLWTIFYYVYRFIYLKKPKKKNQNNSGRIFGRRRRQLRDNIFLHFKSCMFCYKHLLLRSTHPFTN
jgi:hypothetical protein